MLIYDGIQCMVDPIRIPLYRSGTPHLYRMLHLTRAPYIGNSDTVNKWQYLCSTGSKIRCPSFVRWANFSSKYSSNLRRLLLVSLTSLWTTHTSWSSGLSIPLHCVAEANPTYCWMELRNWRLCEQHNYYVQRNNSLLPVARYRETVSVNGAFRGDYSCDERQLLLSVNRLLLLVDSEIRMNFEAKPSQSSKWGRGPAWNAGRRLSVWYPFPRLTA